ncbi:hypothetical protein [Arthrobacter sp. SX1312]|uniref:hypothetical protein n=1 Tax=Arthrobacter sp. SX1312 TaxID=2058896 RepID=UPI000CE41689|nr:hypothetical protein [Arthrobacter sp. SX1312]
MTVDQLITKARHAIETDQPNLARIYMAKALADIAASKPNRNPFAEFMQRVTDGLDHFIEVMCSFGAAVDNANRRTQADFALVPMPLLPLHTAPAMNRLPTFVTPTITNPHLAQRISHGS